MPAEPERAKPERKALTKAVVDAAKPRRRPKKAEARYVADRMIWDTKLKGFGLQVKPSGHKSYVYQYRNAAGRVRRKILGAHGELTPADARKAAKLEAGDVAKGLDPVEEVKSKRREGTVAELAERFLAEHVGEKRKPATARAYLQTLRPMVPHLAERKGSRKPKDPDARKRVEAAVRRLGQRKVKDVTRADVARLHSLMKGTPYLANRTVAVLSKMFKMAERWGLRDDHTNPCTHVEKYREKGRERALDGEELARLGQALTKGESSGRLEASTAAAIRLLLFTGCRLNEILTLKWEHVDIERAVIALPDAKGGARAVLLSAPALEVLAALPKDHSYVIPGKKDGASRNDGLKRPWRWLVEQAKLRGVRIHDLRHTHGSTAGGANLSVLMIAKLLGHKQASTAERYIHPGDDPLRSAAELVSGEIAAALNGQAKGEVTPLRR